MPLQTVRAPAAAAAAGIPPPRRRPLSHTSAAKIARRDIFAAPREDSVSGKAAVVVPGRPFLAKSSVKRGAGWATDWARAVVSGMAVSNPSQRIARKRAESEQKGQ